MCVFHWHTGGNSRWYRRLTAHRKPTRGGGLGFWSRGADALLSTGLERSICSPCFCYVYRYCVSCQHKSRYSHTTHEPSCFVSDCALGGALNLQENSSWQGSISKGLGCKCNWNNRSWIEIWHITTVNWFVTLERITRLQPIVILQPPLIIIYVDVGIIKLVLGCDSKAGRCNVESSTLMWIQEFIPLQKMLQKWNESYFFDTQWVQSAPYILFNLFLKMKPFFYCWRGRMVSAKESITYLYHDCVIKELSPRATLGWLYPEWRSLRYEGTFWLNRVHSYPMFLVTQEQFSL